MAATYDSANGWLTPTTALTPSASPYTVSYTLTDAAGNESGQSPTRSITIDTTPPADPASAPASYNDNAGTSTNTASTAATTDDTTPGIFVGVGLTDTPSLYVDGAKVAATYDSANGWLTPTTPVSGTNGSNTNGVSHTFAYSLTDAAGNESGTSPTRTIVVDTVNDRPVATSYGTTVLEDSGAFSVQVAAFLAGHVTDADANASVQGLFIQFIEHNPVGGTWEYSANGSTGWTAIPAELLAANHIDSAIFLSASSYLRFSAPTNYNNNGSGIAMPLVYFRAVDNSISTVTNTSGQTVALADGVRAHVGTAELDNSTSAVSTAAQWALQVTPVNDAPALTTAGAIATVNEDSSNASAVALWSTAPVYGPGGGADEASQTLSYKITAIPAFITLYKADGTTAVAANSTITAAEFASLKYKTVADANGTGSVTFDVIDSGSSTGSNVNTLSSQSVSITVTSVNDAPVVNAQSTNTDYTENGSALAANSAITLSDVDSANLTGATVTISAGLTAGDVLAFTNANGITGNYNSGTGVLTLSGNATVAQYQAALQSVTYASTSDNPTATSATRTLSWQVDDGGSANNLSNAGTSTITVTPLNDASTGAITLTGTLQVGQTLTANSTLADPDGAITGLTYQWQSSIDGTNWTNISGATASTYTVTDAEIGKHLQAVASYSAGGFAETATSNYSASVPVPDSLDLGTVSGVNLNLIHKVVTQDGRIYYFLDVNDDNLATAADDLNHNALDTLFNGGADTTGNSMPTAGQDTERSVIVNGHTLILPTKDELLSLYADPTVSNPPTGWGNFGYWSATENGSNKHYSVGLNAGITYNNNVGGDTNPNYVALQFIPASADTSVISAYQTSFNAILAEANDTNANAGDTTPDATPGSDPTAQDFANIGANIGDAATDAQNLVLLNDIIGAAQTADVNTVAEIEELARIANAIQLKAAGGTPNPALTADDFAKIGIAGVTADNLAAVQQAIAAKLDDGSQTDSLSELQAAIDTAVAAYATAIDKIADYAETGAVAPADTDYAAAGVTGVTSANLAAINDAINAQAGADTTVGNANDRDAADTAAEVQAIVDAYTDILAAADGTDANTSGAAVPTQGDYQAIGVTGLSLTGAALLSDVIDGKQTADVNTVAKVQALANAVQAVLGYDDPVADAATAPTAAQINALVAGQTVGGNTLGANAVSDDALAAVRQAIDAANSDGSAIASQQELANVVQAALDAYTAALSAISAAAEGNTATASTPSAQTYADAGVTGVTADNLAAINSALSSGTPGDAANVAGISGGEANTAAELQAIVNSYNAILAEANDTHPTPGNNTADATVYDPVVQDYVNIGANIGAAATDTEKFALFSDIVAGAQKADVNTVAEIEELARIANAIQTVVAGGTPSPALSVPDLAKIGLDTTGLTADNLPTLLAVFANEDDTGIHTNTLAALQSLIDNFDKVAPVFTSGSTGTVAENAATSVTAYDATADADSGITYTFGGGADDALFDINASTGVVTFKASPNYEAPTDAGANNVYNVTVRATDAAGNVTDKAVAITVTDANEAPVIDISGNVVNTDLSWTDMWSQSNGANTVYTRSTANTAIDFSSGPSATGKAQLEVVFRITDDGYSGSTTAPSVFSIYITSGGVDTLYATVTGSPTGYANGTGQFTIAYANGATGTLNGTSATQGSVAPIVNASNRTDGDSNTNGEQVYTLLLDLPADVANSGAIKFEYNTQGSDGAGSASAGYGTLWFDVVRVYNNTALPTNTGWDGTWADFDGPAGGAQVSYLDPNTQQTVTIQLEDGGWNGWGWQLPAGETIPAGATNVTVTATASHAGHYQYWSEGSAAASVVTPNMRVTDVDANSHLESATVTLSNRFAGDQLTVNGSAVTDGASGTISANGVSLGYTAAVSNGAVTITLSGTSSAATYQAALRQIGYTSTSQNPDTSVERNIEITVNDGVNNSNTAINKIYVNAINDRPTTTQASVTLSAVAEDTAAPAGDTVANLFGGAYADAEGGTMSGVMVTANAATAGQGTWQWYDSGTSSWTNIATTTSLTSAVWLSSSTLVRFVPANNYSGTPGALTARVADSTIRNLANGSTHNIDASSPAGWGWDGPTDALSKTSVTLGTSITAVNDAPTGSVSISGTPTVGQTLTASHNLVDPDGVISGLGYQWQVSDGSGGWTNISGATNATFVLTSAEQGKAVRAVATYSDGAFSNTANSSATSAVAAAGGAIINPTPTDPYSTSYNNNPKIVSTGTDGSFVVSWYGKDAGGDNSIYVQKYNADGTARGAQVKLEGDNLTNTDDNGNNLTALGTSGQYVVTWYGYGDTTGTGTDYSVFVQKFNADGTKAGSMNRLERTGDTSGNEIYNTVTPIGTDGSFIVGFSAGTTAGYTLQRYDSNGAPVGAQMQVASGAARLGSLTTLPDGSVVVAVEEIPSGSSYYSTYVQKFAADGTAVGSMQTYTATAGGTAAHALSSVVKAVGNSGAYVVAYSDWSEYTPNYAGCIYVQPYNSAGVAGTKVRLDMTGVTAKMDDAPVITSLDNAGSFVVAWQATNASNGLNMCLQKFNADGTTSGSQVVLTSPGGVTAANYSPKLATLPDGSFVITWSGQDSTTAPNDDRSIYVQKISKDMVVTGDVVKLEATGNTQGNDYGPAEVTATGTDGSFAVTWAGYTGVGTGGTSQIYVRQFAAGELDPPTLVSSTPGDNSYVTAADINTNHITLTFAGPVTLGTSGTIVLKSLDAGGTDITINMASLGSNAVSVSGNTVTINPGADLTAGKNYAVQVTSGAIKGTNGVSYTLSDTTTLNFGTFGSDGSITPSVSIDGVQATSVSGNAVSSAGDVNGDGYDDFIIGAPQWSAGSQTYEGRNYVVFGTSAGIPSTALANATAGNGGFIITGEVADDRTGVSVSSAGDLNGDGLADLLVTSRLFDFGGAGSQNIGRSYVVYGKTDTNAVALTAVAAGSGGFAINGQSAGDNAGISVSAAGDVNGDGISDLVIGAWGWPNVAYTGRSYVVFGSTGNAAVNLSAVAGGTGGFAMTGEAAGDRSGYAVSNAGDVNGDGLADVIVGGYWADPTGGTDGGKSYVVFGKTDGTAINLSALTSGSSTQGFVINGQAGSDLSGFSVSSAGDVNGDGLADLVVGAYQADPAGGTDAGKTYVVFGKASGAVVNLSAVATGTGGFVINGQSASDNAGYSVSSAGDINGDGLADLIVSAWMADPVTGTDAGRAYVVYGQTGTGAIDLSTVAAGLGGFVINGQSAGDSLGYSVSAAGDINGDGYGDLIVGAYAADPNALNFAGKSYIIYGGPQFVTGAIATGTGTSASELVIGTSGNDTLTGGGGVDRFSAGLGNDTIVLTATDVSNLGNTSATALKARVDGGNGYDSIRLSGGANLDLTAISNVGAMTGATGENLSRISDIERIDLVTDGAANTLTLTATDVNDMAGMNLIRTGSVSADGKTWTNVSGTAVADTTKYHQLVVDGTAVDGLTLEAGIGAWYKAGKVNNGTSDYFVWQNDTTHSQVMTSTSMTVTNNDVATAPALDLGTVSGVRLNLINPIAVASNGKTYYYLDASADGTNAGSDTVTHNALDTLLNAGTDTSGTTNPTANQDTERSVVVNGFTVILPVGADWVALYNNPVNASNTYHVPTGWNTGDYYWLADNNGTGGYHYVGNFQLNGANAGGTYADGNPAHAFLQVISSPLAPIMALATDAGTSASDGVTNVATINVSGLHTGGISGWQYAVDGGAWVDGTGSSFTAQAGTHTYTVRQANYWGDYSASSSGFAVTIDMSAPTASMAAQSHTVLENATVQSTEAGTAYLVSSGVTVSSVADILALADAQYNSGAILTANTDTSVALTGLAAGTYKLYTADTAGNLSAGTSNLLTVPDTTPPTATLSSTGDFKNTSSVSVQSNEVGTAYLVRNTVTVSSLSDITGAADANWNSVSVGTANSATSLSLAGLSDGTYKLYAVDAAGNLSTVTSNSVTVDTTPPAAPTLSLGANTTTVTVGNLEAGATWQYSTNGGSSWSSSYSSTTTTFSLSSGANYSAGSVKVRETDAAGNFIDAANASSWSTYFSASGISGSSINLGAYGGLTFNLMYKYTNAYGTFFWVKNADGTDSLPTHNTLDSIFNGGSDTTGTSNPTLGQDLERSAIINGYTVILPTQLELGSVRPLPTGWVSDALIWSADPGSAGYHQATSIATQSGNTFYYTNTYADTINAYFVVRVAPVVLDLNADGQFSYTQQLMDINSDGKLDYAAWAGKQDGVLVWNKYGDGLVHDASQYEFSRYGGKTDLEGLAAAFDTNHDGVLDAQDAQFAEFMVWQDLNGNGVSDVGEVRGLADWGITSIKLTSDGISRTPATGVTEAGHSSATLADGGSMKLADAAFAFETLPVLDLNALRSAAHMAEGQGSVLTLKLADVLAQPILVQGGAGDVVDLFTGGASVVPSTTQVNGQTYQAFDLNHDGHMDLLVQQAVMVNMH